MYCRKCGNYCKPGERFCSKCGAPLEQNRAAGAGGQPGRKNSGNKGLLIVLIVLALLILILLAGIAVMLVKPDKSGGDAASASVEASAEDEAFAAASPQPAGEDSAGNREPADAEEHEQPLAPETLVQDSYTFVRSDVVSGLEDWEDDEYHIPELRISSADAAAINQELRDAYLADAQTRAANAEADYGDWEWANISYQCFVNGDVLSLLVEARSVYSDYVEYRVYNLSISSGTWLSDEAAVSAAGWGQEDYTRAVKEALLSRFWDMSWPSLESAAADSSTDHSMYYGELEELFNATLTFCHEAQPFLNEKGHLMIAGQHGVPAGGGILSCLVDLEDYELSPHYSEEFRVPDRSELTGDQ